MGFTDGVEGGCGCGREVHLDRCMISLFSVSPQSDRKSRDCIAIHELRNLIMRCVSALNVDEVSQVDFHSKADEAVKSCNCKLSARLRAKPLVAIPRGWWKANL